MTEEQIKPKTKIRQIKISETELDKLKNETAEYKSGWQRARADYENLLRETEIKRKEYLDWSRAQILEEFIPIYDNFKKAFSVEFGEIDQKTENWKKGIEYIMKQFRSVLANNNIEEIKTVGEKFDANLHEAVSEEEGQNGEESGIILKEIEAGYLMNGKIIKVAKVITSK
ncbi:MAG: nucleotide exchange factor GrpE [Patescibacteria group bacterium]